MFERFRRTKPKVQEVKPDVRPVHIIPDKYRTQFIEMGYNSKEEIKSFLKNLSRTELMDFEDSKQFDGTAAEDAAWEALSDEEWSRTWPIGEHGYKERIPEIVRDTMKSFEITKLQKQMDGIQKKLDRIVVLFEQAEVCMTGKEVLKL